eukprot:IDg12312t1
MLDDALSTRISRYVDRTFRVRVVRRAHPRLIGLTSVIKPSVRLPGRASCLEADLAIGRPSFVSGHAVFSPGNLPHIILEITSSNISNDIIRKRNLYEKARIEYYVIFNRRDQTGESYVLRNGSYKRTVLGMNDTFTQQRAELRKEREGREREREGREREREAQEKAESVLKKNGLLGNARNDIVFESAPPLMARIASHRHFSYFHRLAM